MQGSYGLPLVGLATAGNLLFFTKETSQLNQAWAQSTCPELPAQDWFPCAGAAQDEALGRYSVSREVPRSILKYKTVLGTLDATPKVP